MWSALLIRYWKVFLIFNSVCAFAVCQKKSFVCYTLFKSKTLSLSSFRWLAIAIYCQLDLSHVCFFSSFFFNLNQKKVYIKPKTLRLQNVTLSNQNINMFAVRETKKFIVFDKPGSQRHQNFKNLWIKMKCNYFRSESIMLQYDNSSKPKEIATVHFPD